MDLVLENVRMEWVLNQPVGCRLSGSQVMDAAPFGVDGAKTQIRNRYPARAL